MFKGIITKIIHKEPKTPPGVAGGATDEPIDHIKRGPERLPEANQEKANEVPRV